MDANTKKEKVKYDRNQASLEKAFPSDYHRIKKKLPSIYHYLTEPLMGILKKIRNSPNGSTVDIEDLVRLASLRIYCEEHLELASSVQSRLPGIIHCRNASGLIACRLLSTIRCLGQTLYYSNV